MTGWFKMDNDLVDRINEVGPVPFAVYCVMLRYTGQTSSCWPSTEVIGERVGIAPRTVRRAIETLLKAGWIARTWRNAGRSREFLITPPKEPDTSVRSDRSGHQCPPTAASKRTPAAIPTDTSGRETTSVSIPKRLKIKTKRGTPLPPKTEIEFPDHLNTTAVQQAAQEWIAHRKKIRKPIKDQPASFAGWFEEFTTPTAFVGAVKFSKKQGYQGLFSPGGKHGSRQTTDRPSSRY